MSEAEHHFMVVGTVTDGVVSLRVDEAWDPNHQAIWDPEKEEWRSLSSDEDEQRDDLILAELTKRIGDKT